MPRYKTITSIEAEISETEQKIVKAKARYEQLCKKLADLQKERDLRQGAKIVAALKKSRKTFRELMTFLGE